MIMRNQVDFSDKAAVAEEMRWILERRRDWCEVATQEAIMVFKVPRVPGLGRQKERLGGRRGSGIVKG